MQYEKTSQQSFCHLVNRTLLNISTPRCVVHTRYSPCFVSSENTDFLFWRVSFSFKKKKTKDFINVLEVVIRKDKKAGKQENWRPHPADVD